MTLLLAAVAVPLNTVFGTVAAINITRNEFPGKVGSWWMRLCGSAIVRVISQP